MRCFMVGARFSILSCAYNTWRGPACALRHTCAHLSRQACEHALKAMRTSYFVRAIVILMCREGAVWQSSECVERSFVIFVSPDTSVAFDVVVVVMHADTQTHSALAVVVTSTRRSRRQSQSQFQQSHQLRAFASRADDKCVCVCVRARGLTCEISARC